MRPRSKALLTAAIMAGVLSTAFLLTRALNAARRSPNGFNPPQCTWWADQRCAENGWRLQFKQDHGRDAWLWPALLINAKEIARPEPGCIVVFAPWTGGPVGHVAVVESVVENSFTISHANYAIGEIARSVETVPIRRVEMNMSNGCVRFVGGGVDFKVTYLARK